jgi:hypothetical protein
LLFYWKKKINATGALYDLGLDLLLSAFGVQASVCLMIAAPTINTS